MTLSEDSIRSEDGRRKDSWHTIRYCPLQFHLHVLERLRQLCFPGHVRLLTTLPSFLGSPAASTSGIKCQHRSTQLPMRQFYRDIGGKGPPTAQQIAADHFRWGSVGNKFIATATLVDEPEEQGAALTEAHQSGYL